MASENVSHTEKFMAKELTNWAKSFFFFLNKDLKEIQGFEEKSVFNTFKKP